MTPFKLATKIPAPWRAGIYSFLATLYGLELIFDVVEDGLQNKLLAAAAVLGFSIAIPNTPAKGEA